MRLHLPNLGLDRFSGIYLAGLLIVVFGVWTPNSFLTSVTVQTIATQQATVAIVAIAVLVPMAAGCYDLSVGATANMAAILAVVLQNNEGWGPWPAIVATLGVSALIGLVNAFFVVVLKVNSFIATLGMSSILAALMAIISGSVTPAGPISPIWSSITQREVAGFQVVFFYMLIIVLLIWWLLDHTPAGRFIYACGGNSDAARLAGVRTNLWTGLSLVISAFLCGIAGILFASLTGPSLTFGASMLLPAFAAVFLGSTQVTPGRVNVWGTLIALYVLAIGVKGLQLVTGVAWLSDLFNGVALITAVAFATWRQSRAKVKVAPDRSATRAA